MDSMIRLMELVAIAFFVMLSIVGFIVWLIFGWVALKIYAGIIVTLLVVYIILAIFNVLAPPMPKPKVERKAESPRPKVQPKTITSAQKKKWEQEEITLLKDK